jgi:hypothetical protein
VKAAEGGEVKAPPRCGAGREFDPGIWSGLVSRVRTFRRPELGGHPLAGDQAVADAWDIEFRHYVTYPPDTVFGYMANRLCKGHRAALVSLKGQRH